MWGILAINIALLAVIWLRALPRDNSYFQLGAALSVASRMIMSIVLTLALWGAAGWSRAAGWI